MKLKSAKCPNCGADLKVNPNNETTKCEYCKSAILIEDAIAKYKLEVSGEVEIKNLPKIDNYLKLAERNYKNKEYNEAYKNYGLVLELDPNNTLALLRYAICKTLLNNYIDFNLDYLMQSFNDVVKILNDTKTYEKNIEKYITETIDTTDKSLDATIVYYNSYTVTESDLIEIQKKLISIFHCYELMFSHTENMKEYVKNKIISVLGDIVKDKNYRSGHGEYGGDVIKTYRINAKERIYFNSKLKQYKSGADVIPDEELDEEKIENYIKEEKEKKEVKGSLVILGIFLWMLILGSFSSGQIFSSMMLFLIFLVSIFEEITNKIITKTKLKKKYIIMILIALLMICISIGI